ncbi:MAG: cupin domain-containing protein [Candidatus Bathyarchaeia archaeon]
MYPHTVAHPKHVHLTSEEILYAASGKGKAIIGDETFQSGAIVYVPLGVGHTFVNELGDDKAVLGICASGSGEEDHDYAKTGKGYERACHSQILFGCNPP